MYKVLITDGLEKEGIERLNSAGFEVNTEKGMPKERILQEIPKYDALIVRSATKVDEEILKKGSENRGLLKIVGRAGVGVDNIDKTAENYGIVVANAPEGSSISVAELSVALMLSLSRNIPNSSHALRQGDWKKDNGSELFEKTLGVIGCGRIGAEVARKAKYGFDMNVIGYDPCPKEETGIKFVSMDDLLGQSDYIAVHAPKRAEPIIGSCEIGAMKKTAYLIDVSRGGNVDEEILYHALKNNVIAGAAKDVFVREGKKFTEDYASGKKNPLLELNNFIGTPHLGASTKEGQRRTSVEMVNVVVDYLKNGKVRNSANTIVKKMDEGTETYNLFVTHKDVPGVFADISAIFKSGKLNLLEQNTKYFKNTNGHTIYRCESQILDSMIEDINKIPEVYRAVR